MANASTLSFITTGDTQFAVPELTVEAAEKISSLLQENHGKNDIIFSDSGFHSKWNLSLQCA